MSTGNLEIIHKTAATMCCEPGKKSPDSIRSKQKKLLSCSVIQELGTVESPRFGGGPSTEK